jgi:hypothetical protein
MHVLYSRTTFVLFDLSGLQTFTTRTPIHYLNVITSLTLTWFVFPPLYLRNPNEMAFYGKKYNPTPTEQAWSNLCNQLAQMPRLNKIRITIHNFDLTGLKLLEPLIEAFGGGEEEEGETICELEMEKGNGRHKENAEDKKRKIRREVPDFEVTFDYKGHLPLDTTGRKDVPFRIRLLNEHEEWRSAAGARVWPPPPYREPTTWDRLGRRSLSICGGVAAVAWRGVGSVRGLVASVRWRIR